jgi:hypothetical protein
MKAKSAGLMNLLIAIIIAALMLTQLVEVKTALSVYALIVAVLGILSKGYTKK